MKRFNPAEIEPKWQQIWDETKIYKADLKSSKPKYMALSMFNYPSGAGIHIGHAMTYTISDVKARFKRQQGYESYHPIGWDSFGLPAENYAIKTGVSPQASMAEIIPGYHKQYKAMGWSNDWDKEIATHEPSYYKWSQWIFAQMFKHGLAYQDARKQWWCDIDKTVLSNEQVIEGKCWRHDGPNDPLVEQKEVKQWFFKITEYADELLEATDGLDWTESVKLAQKNWIGKSVGAEIDFAIENTQQSITVFTTRPDTIYGATFLVLAPEHELVASLTTPEQKAAVDDYVKAAQKKTELERQTSKEKSGVFTGGHVLNPATHEKIPVWIADYVLNGYGTGAIMAVPAHDERDNEFAKAFDLPIVRVVKNEASDDECTHGEGLLMNSGAFDDTPTEQARELVVQHLAREDKATEKVNYRMRDWSVSRQRYWGAPVPIVHCDGCGPQLVPDEQLPVILPELVDFHPSGDGRSALARATDWIKATCPNCGGEAERETDTLDTYICSSWYMFRYLDPRNSEQIFDSELANKWAPVDFYNGADHATAHMLYARFITRFFSKIGLLDNPEPFAHFLFNGKVTASDGMMFSKSKGNGVDPLEIINQGYGADALRTYLMFAAPLELWAKWDPQGVPGTHRFLNRLFTLVQVYVAAKAGELDVKTVREIQIGTHQMIKKMTIDIEENRYNTAIAAAMARVNELYKLKVDHLVVSPVWQEALEALVACVAPFAPHTADELWHELGNETSVQRDSWPKFDEALTVGDMITIAVQVNGKVRAEVSVAKDASKEDLESAALTHEKIVELVGESEPKRVVVVPGRLVNVVL